MHYDERLNESDGPLFYSFPIRCRLSDVDVLFSFNHQN